jgi:alpha-L-fucosidase
MIAFAGLLAIGLMAAAEAQPPPIPPGPFQPTMASLKQYRCPQWFRDAKLGIWAHWGPQAVPMAGDWYARNMYIQGHRQYQHHLDHYGHPARSGYKDIIPLWRAEKWDPDRLMALYKKAGARYFVSMGCHHDNFDLWNSRYNPWNAVQMGPKRDVVGEWQRAAHRQGLKFGVSEHLGASFTWFQTSHGSDKEGPFAGVPYDGADVKYQDLYHFPAEPGDTEWYSKDPRWHRIWFQRIRDLVDRYHPDLLYTDGGVPFGNETGLALIAHLYNSDPHRQGTHNQVVYNCKQRAEGRWVEDLERGVMPGILPEPWQNDTSVGDWYYNADWKYRDAGWVIRVLLDVVSKNGNLLLNIVQRPDGSLDAEVERLLEQMAAWMAVHGEGIYGTRPWVVHGEGPARARGGHFSEDVGFTAADVRYTWKRGVLYAFILGQPQTQTVVLRSLGTAHGPGRVRNVALMGSKAKLTFRQESQGLTVHLPTTGLSGLAVGLKITGTRLRDFAPPPPAAPVAQADENGVFALKVEDAELHGSGIRTERRGSRDNLGFWDSASDWPEWKLQLDNPGTYELRFACATPHAGASLTVRIADCELDVPIRPTGSWDEFAEIVAGRVSLTSPGVLSVAIRPRDAATWKAVNLADVRMVPAR